MKITNKKRFIRPIIYVLLLVSVVISYFAWTLFHSNVSIINFSDNWNICLNGKDYGKQNTASFSYDGLLKKGDVFEITNKIPQDIPQASSIIVLTYLSAINIELDGRSIYSYGFDELDKNMMVGSGYHRVRLPENTSGKTIRITIKLGESNAFSSIGNITIMDSASEITFFATSNYINFFISVFLVFTGILLPVIGLLFYFLKRDYELILVIGLLSLSMGLWTMCNTKMLQLFSPDMTWNTLVEYISLYIAPIPLMRLIDILRGTVDERRKVKYNAIYLSTLIFGLFFIVAVTLHLFNVLHICQLLPVFHIISFICIIQVIVYLHTHKKELTRADRLMYLAIFVMVIAAIIDMIRFNLQVYVEKGRFFILDKSILPLGTFLFIVILIIGYFAYLYEYYIEQVEKRNLVSMAYTDPLTGLYNRAYYEKEITDVCDHLFQYGIISMDLNGLKFVNDTYGHANGDLLLVTFSDILKESFGKLGEVFRMGGDEFLILIKDPSPRDVAKCLIEMNKLEHEKSEGMLFNIRTAYGEAYSKEVKGNDKEAVYRLADSRMYDMKKKTKKEESYVRR
ncbi:MAG: GGDEF domain-containing protein [Lachnospiraceae bacterium]|nr:GGDEF domain-containing protein [Lachnospiraceae bacterium]